MAASFSYNGYVFQNRPQYGRNVRIEVDPATNRPRRELVTYTVNEVFTEDGFAENQQRYWALATALLTPEGVLKGFDEHGNELFSEPVRVETSTLPAAWNQYFTEVSVSFQKLRNLGGDDSIFAVYAGVVFDGVLNWRESIAVQANAVERTLAFSGKVFADPNLDSSQRAQKLAQLAERQAEMEAAQNVMHGAFAFQNIGVADAYLKTIEATVDDTAEMLVWQLTVLVTTPKPELARSAQLGKLTLPGVRSVNESVQSTTIETTGTISISGSVRKKTLAEAQALEDAIRAGRLLRVAQFSYAGESHKVQVDSINASSNTETFEVTWSASLGFREKRGAKERTASFNGIDLTGVASFRSSAKLENGEWTGTVSASGTVTSFQVNVDDAKGELDAAAAKISAANSVATGAFTFMSFSEKAVDNGGVDLTFAERTLSWSFQGSWRRVEEVRTGSFAGVDLPGVTMLKRGMRSENGRLIGTVTASGRVDTLTRNLPDMEAMQARLQAVSGLSGAFVCLGTSVEELVLGSLECEIQNDVLTWSLAGSFEDVAQTPMAKYAGLALPGVATWTEGGMGLAGTVAAAGKLTGTMKRLAALHAAITALKKTVSGQLSFGGFSRTVTMDQLESAYAGGTELSWTLRGSFRDANSAGTALFAGVEFPNVTQFKDALKAAKTDSGQDEGTITITGNVFSTEATVAARVADFQMQRAALMAVRGNRIGDLVYGGKTERNARLDAVECDEPSGESEALRWTLTASYVRDAREALAVVVGELRLGGVTNWQSGVKSDGRGRYDGTVTASGKIVPPAGCATPGAWLRLAQAAIDGAPTGPGLAVAYQGFSQVCIVPTIEGHLNEEAGEVTWSFNATYKIKDTSSIEYEYVEKIDGGEKTMTVSGTARGGSARTDVESLVAGLVGDRAWKVSGSFTERHKTEGKFDGEYAPDDLGEYAFSYEYRQSIATDWTLTVTTRRERDGMLVRSYTGMAKAETEAAAQAQAEALSADAGARLISSSFAVTSASVKREFECQFTVEYEAGAELYAELSSEVNELRFGDCSQSISGFAVAATKSAALEFARTFRAMGTAGMLKENRETTKSSADETTLQYRVDFTYGFFAPRTQFQAAVKYSKRTTTDYRTGESSTTYSGQVWADNASAAQSAIAGFYTVPQGGRLTTTESSENYADTIFEGLNFSVGMVVQGGGIYEAELSVKTVPSRDRSIITRIPFGTPSVQRNCGVIEGMRTVTGNVTAAALEDALDWARGHMELVSDGDDVEAPEETVTQRYVRLGNGDTLGVLVYSVSFSYGAKYAVLAQR